MRGGIWRDILQGKFSHGQREWRGISWHDLKKTFKNKYKLIFSTKIKEQYQNLKRTETIPNMRGLPLPQFLLFMLKFNYVSLLFKKDRSKTRAIELE